MIFFFFFVFHCCCCCCRCRCDSVFFFCFYFFVLFISLFFNLTHTFFWKYIFINFFLFRSLSKNKKITQHTRAQQRTRPYLGERIQALKVVRRIMELAPLLMPRGIVFSLDAIARDVNDSLRLVCLETLRQLVVFNVSICCLPPSILLSSVICLLFSVFCFLVFCFFFGFLAVVTHIFTFNCIKFFTKIVK